MSVEHWQGIYETRDGGRILTLVGLQFWLSTRVNELVREAAGTEEQRVRFPQLAGAIAPKMLVARIP